MFCKDLKIKFIENIESNNEFRRHLMQDSKDAKQKKLDNLVEILSVDESTVRPGFQKRPGMICPVNFAQNFFLHTLEGLLSPLKKFRSFSQK